VEFAGILSIREQKTHVAHRVELSSGASALGVRIEYPRGPGLGHMICLSAFDARGFRGSGHRMGTLLEDRVVHEVRIARDEATPGYLPGPLPAGELSIWLHAHRIVPGEPCRYRLVVEWEGEGFAAAPLPRVAEPRSSVGHGPGWYRGDLHAHTRHSDGTWDVSDLLREARDAGLDFVALTDHNTTSHLADVGELPDPRPLVIPGMELTTFHGHALCLGTHAWIDWGVLRRDGMEAAAAEVHGLGGLFVIAHPLAGGDPVCTGCDWRYADMMPGAARAVEIWNGPWTGSSNNERALALWYAWLNQGWQIVATAGSDAHAPDRIAFGTGRNVVRADDLSPRTILEAIAAGRSYLSAGPRLKLAVDALPNSPADVRAAWHGCPAGAVVRLVADGRVSAESPAVGDGDRRWEGIRARWCVVELRDRDGAMLAVTNPVYLA
jgi:hypothetical protein